MWGIALIDTRGETVDRIDVDAPFEAMRDWCRRALAACPTAAQARLLSAEGLLDYVYPEGLPDKT